MTEITIKIPSEFKDIVDEVGESAYVEALKIVYKKKLVEKEKKIQDIHFLIQAFEEKHHSKFSIFEKNISDSVESHDDWIEWSYLERVSIELEKSIKKLYILLGE